MYDLLSLLGSNQNVDDVWNSNMADSNVERCPSGQSSMIGVQFELFDQKSYEIYMTCCELSVNNIVQNRLVG